MEKQLLDSDILIDVPPGIGARRHTCGRIPRVHGRLTISAPAVAEIVKGYRKVDREDRIATFMASLTRLEVLPFDSACAEVAGRILADLDSSGTPIGRIDPLIAAIAVRHDLTLVTGNARHFERVRQLGFPLRLDDWRQPAAAPEPGST